MVLNAGWVKILKSVTYFPCFILTLGQAGLEEILNFFNKSQYKVLGATYSSLAMVQTFFSTLLWKSSSTLLRSVCATLCGYSWSAITTPPTLLLSTYTWHTYSENKTHNKCADLVNALILKNKWKPLFPK